MLKNLLLSWLWTSFDFVRGAGVFSQLVDGPGVCSWYAPTFGYDGTDAATSAGAPGESTKTRCSRTVVTKSITGIHSLVARSEF